MLEKKVASRKARFAAAAGLLLLLAFLAPSWRSFLPMGEGDPSNVAVSSVHDGDTVTVWLHGKSWKLRLHGIDTPELAQAWGPEARDLLKELVQGRRFALTMHGTDVYGRVLAELRHLDGRSLEEELLRKGAAWCYRRGFSPEDMAEGGRGRRLLRLEADARAAHLGLWAEKDPEAPWDWRQRKREGARR